jgi:hypothetical protein
MQKYEQKPLHAILVIMGMRESASCSTFQFPTPTAAPKVVPRWSAGMWGADQIVARFRSATLTPSPRTISRLNSKRNNCSLGPDPSASSRSVSSFSKFNMSRVVTATELQGVLSDYTIHLTGHDPVSEASESTTSTISNPPNWPTDHRRVPNYRPVDRNRDAESRPNATGFERVFLTIMFTGVVMNAVSEHHSRTEIQKLIFN